MPTPARWSIPILLTSTRSRRDVLSAPAKHELLTNCKPPPFCWHHQYGAHHPGDVTAMFATEQQFFDPYPLFQGSKRGSPSKNFEPRKILGLRNPHRARRRGAVPFRRRAGRGDGRPGRCRAAGGRHPGRRQAVRAEKEGDRGLDKAAIA